MLAALAEPPALELREAASGQLVRRYPASSLTGEPAAAVDRILVNAPRRSFVVGFRGLRELWEISWDPAAEPIFDGLVHDYRMGEALPRSGFLGVRRTPLEAPFTLLAADAGGRYVLGAGPGEQDLDILNLDVRRRTGRVALSFPVAGALITVSMRDGRSLARVAAASGDVLLDVAAGRLLVESR